MNSLDLLQHRLNATRRESERIDALLEALDRLPANIDAELQLLGWDSPDRLAVMTLALSKLQRDVADRCLP